MEDEKLYDPPRETIGDHLHTLARAGLGAIPVVGDAAIELFRWLLTPPFERRQKAWMESIAQGLRGLEYSKGVNLEALQGNDTFIDTVLMATQTALRNNQADKIQALRNGVLNAALPNSPEQAIQQIFLTFIDSFTVWHLRILKLFDDPGRWFSENGRTGLTVTGSALHNILEEAYPEMKERRMLYDQVVKDLHIRGLLAIDSLHSMMTGAALLQRRTTDLGQQFIAFVRDPAVR
jgi:hypothetical protein